MERRRFPQLTAGPLLRTAPRARQRLLLALTRARRRCGGEGDQSPGSRRGRCRIPQRSAAPSTELRMAPGDGDGTGGSRLLTVQPLGCRGPHFPPSGHSDELQPPHWRRRTEGLALLPPPPRFHIARMRRHLPCLPALPGPGPHGTRRGERKGREMGAQARGVSGPAPEQILRGNKEKCLQELGLHGGKTHSLYHTSPAKTNRKTWQQRKRQVWRCQCYSHQQPPLWTENHWAVSKQLELYFCYIVAVEFGKVDMNTSYKEGRHEDGSTLEPGSMPRGHSYNNTGNMGVSIINTWRTKEAALD
ncbi:uncharacterized protein LOC128840282 isoform X1 [Malaclemys terrapin pileata]|uniref:uncharacterized protein LOC128840282 isoform X1 n=1 Tax=Malaclemys terrapin pileata TaxID=2991368 RepID=UPI0023A80087|nr:uncharacterized protein LOC128840282 isoform X1 [Malaclemys terrapin pileata]